MEHEFDITEIQEGDTCVPYVIAIVFIIVLLCYMTKGKKTIMVTKPTIAPLTVIDADGNPFTIPSTT